MTRESGKRTRLRFGSVSAEVSLVKASTKPREAQHETRRVLVEQIAAGGKLDAAAIAAAADREPTTDPFGDPATPPAAAPGLLPTEVHEGELAHIPPGLLGPMGDPTWPSRDERLSDPVDGPFDPTEYVDRPEPREAPVPEADAAGGPGSRVERQAEPSRGPGGVFTDEEREGINPAAPTYVPPATRVEQGVHLEDGKWVDLTDRLAEVDERTRVDGLEVVRTIPASSYASERVRELHYIAGVNPGEFKVLALLWRALRVESKAAEVRWTKRTAQAHGIILARGVLGSESNPAHLALLELEWASNVRKPSARVTGPMGADVGVDEVASAVELVRSFAAPAPRVDLRDERLAKRAELLDLARAGKLAEYAPPAEPMPEDVAAGADGLAAALELAAAWNREHAPA